MKKHFTLKNITFFLSLIIVIFFLGKNLLPSNTMFEFHDETQTARISEFAVNLRSGIIPPRMAPHFSFHMGYPVFNFYAPFSYWITSSLTILGLDVADSFKLSILLAIITAFIGMYAFLRLYFKFIASIVGAILYVATPWLAAEVFVRGNLGEVWFWGLFPLALYAIYEMDEYNSPVVFNATVFILFCILTVHNVFSLLFIPIAAIYIYLIGNRLKNYIGLFLALLLSSYFLVPAILESTLTYAKDVATMTKYADHFLCISQLWSAPFWGFGGSAPGCVNDGMAFMVGKIQIIIGLLGILVYIFYDQIMLKWKKYQPKDIPPAPYAKIVPAVLVLTLLSAFLTTYFSDFIWEIFSFVLSLFQFPWRFLLFVSFGLSFFSTYLFHKLKFKGATLLIIIIGLYALFSASKYFQKNTISKSTYNKRYLSAEYIKNSVAYKIPEYIPKTAKYETWRNLEEKDFSTNEILQTLDAKSVQTEENDAFNKFGQTSSERFLLNIHYFPYWEIKINGEEYKPTKFDQLGRPLIQTMPGKKTVQITYRQTWKEVLGNSITIITFIFLVSLMFTDTSKYKKRFKKIHKRFNI